MTRNMAESSTLLPIELVHIIIDHVHGDRSSLMACALVSRTILYRCRHHLYRKICLRPWERKWDPDLRNGTLSSFLSIAPYVRSVTIDWDDGEASYPGEKGVVFDILPAISMHRGVPTLVSLSSITHSWLHMRNLSRGMSSSSFIPTLLGRGRTSSVKELAFEHCTFPSIHVLSGAAASCTTLEKLTLRHVAWPYMDASTSGPLVKLTSSLRTFGYYGSYDSYSNIPYQWISSQGHLPAIDPLSLNIFLDTVSVASALIANWGGNLKTLKIAFLRNDNAYASFSRCQCLQLASVLQSLHIVLPHKVDIDSDDALVQLTRILSASNLASSLRKLIIEVSYNLDELCRDPSSKWADLKDQLLGFVQLEMIQIKSYMSIGDVSKRGLRNVLEPLVSRGVVLRLDGDDPQR